MGKKFHLPLTSLGLVLISQWFLGGRYGSDNRLLFAMTEDHLQSDDVDSAPPTGSVKADAVQRSTPHFIRMLNR